MSQFPASLAAKEDDVQKMLICQTHIGDRNLNPAMARYIWKRRKDGVHIFDLAKVWEKIVLAARVIVAIENPKDVAVISGRLFGQRAISKFSSYTGASSLVGRFTAGTFTNYLTKDFMEPRVLITSDPATDSQPIKEASYVNIPVIAFCDTDSPLEHVDIAIPCNNKSKHSIGLVWWLLCREVLYLRNTLISRGTPWDVMTDLFFYRDPDQEEKDEELEAGEGAVDWSEQPDWNEQSAPTQDWAAGADDDAEEYAGDAAGADFVGEEGAAYEEEATA
jgi:small subunit ribosomal protein SAe